MRNGTALGKQYCTYLYVSLYRLKIDEMTVDDSGIYTCQGFNQYGRQSTNGTVVVRQGALAYVMFHRIRKTGEAKLSLVTLSYIIMVALWNRADHYIFALWFLLSSICFPRLISAVADWMSAILPHMVWP